MQRTTYVLRKIILLTVYIIGCLSLHAQEMRLEVKSFSLEENALTAKNEPVYDNTQQKCALVIISGMGNEPLSFNFGNSFSKVEEKSINGERVYLMWIPEGVIKVSISSKSNPKKFDTIDYFFNPRVRKAETYLMSLELTKPVAAIDKQYLEFVIEPANAYIEVNDEPWTVTDGIAYKQLPKGSYSYRIQAKDYHTEYGIIDFKDLSSKKSIEIKLKPNYGWLSIISSLQGVTAFIDDEMISGSLNRIKLSSGTHSIRATKEMYLPFSQSVEIKDGEELPLSIVLKPNFSQVKLYAPNNADIYLDDKLIGNGYWNGNLSVGKYKAEIKKEGYRTYTEIVNIPNIGENYDFKFKELEPIYGSVNIESNPPRATVTIDGKDYGKTPLFIPELLIGSHSICVAINGYQPRNETITIREGQQSDITLSLNKETPKQANPTVASTPEPITPKQNGGSAQPNTGKHRYGCINTEEVLKVMPQYAALQQQISQKRARYEQVFAKNHENLQKKIDKYSNSKKLSSKEHKEISNLQTQLEDFKKKSVEEIKQFKDTETAKLQEIIMHTIAQIATAENLEIVIPAGIPVYIGTDVIDITKQVQNKLK